MGIVFFTNIPPNHDFVFWRNEYRNILVGIKTFTRTVLHNHPFSLHAHKKQNRKSIYESAFRRSQKDFQKNPRDIDPHILEIFLIFNGHIPIRNMCEMKISSVFSFDTTISVDRKKQFLISHISWQRFL